jgi:hypothetical protein
VMYMICVLKFICASFMPVCDVYSRTSSYTAHQTCISMQEDGDFL